MISKIEASFATRLVLLSLIASALPLVARAEVAISLGEQKEKAREDKMKGRGMRMLFIQGTGGPGHASLYVSDLCQDGSYFKVRMCTDADKSKGVYFSLMSGLSGKHAWIAVPASVYLYGVDNVENRPLFATTFNTRYYASKEAKRAAELRTEAFIEGRTSSLDAARKAFLGNANREVADGSPDSIDKVNLFGTSERDVYNIWIHGDTKEEARKLMENFNDVKNTIVAPPAGSSARVQGGFSNWKNCTWAVSNWVSLMFGKEVAISGSIFEIGLENPRHYARVFLGRVNKLRKQKKWDREVSVEYLPKVTGDRRASAGFGSPARSLYNPLSLGGFFMWLHKAPIAAGFLLSNLQNEMFSMGRVYRKQSTLAKACAIESADEASLKLANPDCLGSEQEWKQADARLNAALEAARQIPTLPAELQSLLKNRSSVRGAFSEAVIRIMAYRSQARIEKDIHILSLRFKEGREDEKLTRETGVSAATILQGDPALSLMLLLAATDNHLAQKPANRPGYREIIRNLELVDRAVARAAQR